MHAAAKAQIKECYEKNKSGDPQFKSLTISMKARLRSTVGELYWKKAHDYLDHFLKQKKELHQKGINESAQQQGQLQQQSRVVLPPSTHRVNPPPLYASWSLNLPPPSSNRSSIIIALNPN